jgi:hypothetical protein
VEILEDLGTSILSVDRKLVAVEWLLVITLLERLLVVAVETGQMAS